MLLSDLLAASHRHRERDLERISNILHDETGALLTGVGLKLELLRMDGVEGLEKAIEALEKAFDSVRLLSRNVHPKLVERVGLSKAVEALAQTSKKRFSNLHADIAESATGPAEIYLIAEELLDNCIRHSKASTVDLQLTSMGELIVRDDGIGLSRDPHMVRDAGGLGLLRVDYLSGRGHLRVRIRTSPGSGTMFRVTQLTPCHSKSF